MELEAIPWPGGAVNEESLRRRLEDEGFHVWSWTDSAGAGYEPHTHDQDESLWVVAGEITFGAEGREILLRAGDRLMLPAGKVHTAHAGADGATYLVGERRPAER